MPIEHTPKLPATITCTVVRVQKELPQIAKRPKSPQANNPQGTFGSNVPSTATMTPHLVRLYRL